MQRDFILSLAIEGSYRPIWSAQILDELEYHEAKKLEERLSLARDEATQRAQDLVTQMRAAFADAEVVGWEPLVGTFGLPDPDDEHVVAAAVIGGAGVIVTENTKDFPTKLMPNGIQIMSAREFLRDTVALAPQRGLLAVGQLSARSGRFGPSLSTDDVLVVLHERYHLVEAVEMMREVADPTGISDSSDGK